MKFFLEKLKILICMFISQIAWKNTILEMTGQEFDEKFLDSKHVLKVYFKSSRKNKDFVFLPVPILPGWLKILHLIAMHI